MQASVSENNKMADEAPGMPGLPAPINQKPLKRRVLESHLRAIAGCSNVSSCEDLNLSPYISKCVSQQ